MVSSSSSSTVPVSSKACSRVGCCQRIVLPPLFSRITLFVILLLWLIIASITTSVLVKNNYSTLSSSPSSSQSSQAQRWVLMGGLTSSSINFRIRSLPNDSESSSSTSVLKLVVSTDPDLSSSHNDNIVFQKDLLVAIPTTNITNVDDLDGSIATAASDDGGIDMVFHATATGLSPNTLYYYGVVSTSSDSKEIQASGKFRTAPIEGQRSNFKVVSSGCAWTGSEANVFETLYQRQIGGEDIDDSVDDSAVALFFLHLGDFHYGDLTTDSLERRVEEVDNVLASQKQRTLWSNIPLAYMWDDHDWLDNNSGGDPSQPGFNAALRSYALAFPHYEPLPSVEWHSQMYQNQNINNMTSTMPAVNSEMTTVGMYHAFTIGTVRFIISDLRSEATNGHIYSSIQRDWLFKELERSPQYDYVIWASTKPWNGEREDGSDSWAGYDDDRRELSNHIDKVVTKRNLMAVSADAHMVAFDDGSHTYYGGEGTIGGIGSSIIEGKESFPILQTGPLDRMGSIKGGPYSDGCQTYEFERSHQYSVIEFRFNQEDESGVENPCISIQSYNDDKIIFERELCGQNIFSPVVPTDENVGSCSEQFFSPTNTALVCVAGVLLIISMAMSFFVFPGCWASLSMSFMIFIMFGLTFGIGIAIPLAKGIIQYDAFETILICLLQMLNATIYLLCWRCYGAQTNDPKEIETDMIGKDPEELQ
mmetsp:Transcript_14518/g.35198  ORF Transcript_14518/g.35198 Transcript_14518/m.35198 type:complete len:704 (-) Transcript_14518:111-2222(-)